MLSEQDRLVLENQRLVYYVYERLSKNSLTRTYKDDLISEGMLGLVKAAQGFDVSRGCKFSTYAAQCIRNQMLMFLRKLNKHSCEVSLCAPVGKDGEGNEILFEDILEDSFDIAEETMVKIRYETFTSRLKPRHRHILEAYAQGYTQKEIAAIVGLSQSYVSRIMYKLKKRFKENKRV